MKKPTRSGPTPWVLTAPLVALALLIGIASFLPERRLWGINHLAYFPLPVRTGALALVAASFVPAVQRAFHARLAGAIDLARSRRSAPAIVAAAALAAGVLFHVLQSSSLLLGDGYLISNSYDRGLAGDTRMGPSSAANIVLHKPISPGSALLYYGAAKAVTSVSDAPATTGIRLFNVLLGTILVGVVLWIVVRSSLPAASRLWFGILFFTSGAMELFCGYVEYYPPLVFFGTLYVMALWRAIHGRGRAWLPIALAIACCYLHVQAVLLLPSLLLFLTWRLAGRRRAAALRYGTPGIVVLVSLAAGAAALFTPLAKHFLPPVAGGEGYGVLSPAHGADVANELLLLFPAVMLFLAMALVRGGSGGSGGSRPPADDSPAWFTLPVERHVAGLLLFPGVLFLLFFDPEIGMARDWDLFAVVMFGLVPAALLQTRRLDADGQAHLTRLAVPASVTGAVLVTAWIGVNASPLAAAQRFEDILAYDRSRSDYSYETLSRHYHRLGRLPEAIAAQEKAVAISGNPRQELNLSMLYREHGDTERSLAVLRRIVANRPTTTAARRDLILQLFQLGRYRECAAVAREGIALEPDNAMHHFVYGRCLLLEGRTAEGRAQLVRARALGVPPETDRQIDAILAEIERAARRQGRKPPPGD